MRMHIKRHRDLECPNLTAQHKNLSQHDSGGGNLCIVAVLRGSATMRAARAGSAFDATGTCRSGNAPVLPQAV